MTSFVVAAFHVISRVRGVCPPLPGFGFGGVHHAGLCQDLLGTVDLEVAVGYDQLAFFDSGLNQKEITGPRSQDDFASLREAKGI